MSAVQVHRPLAQGDKAFSRQCQLTEETWEKLLEAKKQESAAEHQKRIKNWVQSHARLSGKDEVPAGTYDRDCQALYERIRGVA